MKKHLTHFVQARSTTLFFLFHLHSSTDLCCCCRPSSGTNARRSTLRIVGSSRSQTKWPLFYAMESPSSAPVRFIKFASTLCWLSRVWYMSSWNRILTIHCHRSSQATCEAAGAILSLPCKACGLGCDSISALCRSPFCMYTSFTLGLNIPGKETASGWKPLLITI